MSPTTLHAIFLHENSSAVIVSSVPALTSDHEEPTVAFSYMPSMQSNAGFACVVISSPDTDIAAIGIHHAYAINGSLHAIAHWHKLRSVSLTDIAVNLGEDMSAALPGIHAFLDVTSRSSAFAGKGETKIFRLASQTNCLRNYAL